MHHRLDNIVNVLKAKVKTGNSITESKAETFSHNKIDKTPLEKGGADGVNASNDATSTLNTATESGHTGTISISASGGNMTMPDQIDWRYVNADTASEQIKAETDADDWIELMNAVQQGDTDTVRALIKKGADVNVASTPDRVTALMAAAYGGHADTVSALIRTQKMRPEPRLMLKIMMAGPR